jgi:hypothetical protein
VQRCTNAQLRSQLVVTLLTLTLCSAVLTRNFAHTAQHSLIIAGDRIEISFPYNDATDHSNTELVSLPPSADATIIGAAATRVFVDPADATGRTLIVEGTLTEPLTDVQGMEQRIVNPELTDLEIGRRDIRAVTGDQVIAGEHSDTVCASHVIALLQLQQQQQQQ